MLASFHFVNVLFVESKSCDSLKDAVVNLIAEYGITESINPELQEAKMNSVIIATIMFTLRLGDALQGYPAYFHAED